MANYKILCKSLTGKKGRIMIQGQTYPETYFVSATHISEHLKAGHIEDVTAKSVPEPAIKDKPVKQPNV